MMARTSLLSAVQNHSLPGPMSAIPSVLMSVTRLPSCRCYVSADGGRVTSADASCRPTLCGEMMGNKGVGKVAYHPVVTWDRRPPGRNS